MNYVFIPSELLPDLPTDERCVSQRVTYCGIEYTVIEYMWGPNGFKVQPI